MKDLLVFPKILGMFFSWYYFDAPKSIIRIWRNFILFVLNYFSIGLLFKTLFSPWKRISESRGRGFDLMNFLSVLTLNIFSRFIGFLIRSVVIVFGLILEVMVIVFGFVFSVFWLLLPLFLIFTIFEGIRLL